MRFSCDVNNPSDYQNTENFKPKLYAFNGLCTAAACALLYRDLAAADWRSSTAEVVFQVIPPYVQTLVTLVDSAIRKTPIIRCRASGPHRKTDVKSLHGIYWPSIFTLLIVSNWLRLSSDRSRSVFTEGVLQMFVCFVPIIYEMRYCRVCTEFRNDYRELNELVADRRLTTKKLLAVRAERNGLNELVARTVGCAEILSEIAAAAVAAVFKIHRVLRPPTERSSGNAADVPASDAADLLDVFHHVLRLYALCKVSGDVADEANEIVTNLLNANLSTDKDLENEVSYFLWEIVNPPLEVRLVYGTFALNPRLFVSVFSWCIGFVLILLQFRWPRTH